MSVVITCTIKVEQQKYDISTEGEVFTESQHVSSTGSFASLPKEFLENFIDSAAEGAVKNAKNRLDLLKGKG